MLKMLSEVLKFNDSNGIMCSFDCIICLGFFQDGMHVEDALWSSCSLVMDLIMGNHGFVHMKAQFERK